MPYISTFMYSENSLLENTSEGERLHIVNPQQVFEPVDVFGIITFHVTFGILDLSMEQKNNFRYLFYFENDEDKPIIDTGDIELPSNIEVATIGLMLNMDFQKVPLVGVGKYISKLIINNNDLGKYPIKVIKRRG